MALLGRRVSSKALQGSETEELLGGMEENSCFPDQGSVIYTKREQEKIELGARPGFGLSTSGSLRDRR